MELRNQKVLIMSHIEALKNEADRLEKEAFELRKKIELLESNSGNAATIYDCYADYGDESECGIFMVGDTITTKYFDVVEIVSFNYDDNKNLTGVVVKDANGVVVTYRPDRFII